MALAFSVGFTREPVTNASLIAIGCGFTTVLMMLGDAWLKLTIRRMKVIEDNQLRMFQQSLRVEHVHLKTTEALASRLLGDDTSTDEN